MNAGPGGTGRAEVTQAAVAAAVETARAHGVRAEDPVVLHDLFAVRVHLRPAPIVARVPTWVTRLRTGTDWVGREIDVVDHLARAGVPVVAPSPELPFGPHAAGGFTISFWTYVDVDPDRVVTVDECAAMLPDLHSALAGYSGDLPTLAAGPVDLDQLFAAADAVDHGVSAGDMARFRAAADQLRPLLVAGTPDAVLHGDAHPGNLLPTPAGLLWSDFEDVSRGPLEWDLATLADESTVRAHYSIDPARLAAFGRLRALQVGLCLVGLRDVMIDEPGWDVGIRWTLDSLPAGGG